MLGFPLPYPDELIYSTIARYGIHSGLTSPKELLHEVFGKNTIIATSDLHGHLEQVAELYPGQLNIQPESLLYKHTLFPLYALFIGESRRAELKKLLLADKVHSVHVMSGFAASRITQPYYLRYCPKCIEQQWNQFGECFWRRDWQIAGMDYCPLHGELKETAVRRTSYKRHVYTAADLKLCSHKPQSKTNRQSYVLNSSITSILNLPEQPVPTVIQWGLFYKALACDFGFNRGCNIEHEEVARKVTNYWSESWLKSVGLKLIDSDTCWLRSLFRKHRKSFSYLEHLVVLHAFLGDTIALNDVIKDVKSYEPGKSVTHSLMLQADKLTILKRRRIWLKAIKNKGTKRARLEGAGGDYAWLYRHDRAWLLSLNAKLMCKRSALSARVNWSSFDRGLLKALISIRDCFEIKLESPRRSRNWYFNQLDHKSKVEKNLYKLPLCKLFLSRYTETIADYQIRRITHVAIERHKQSEHLKRWDVLRSAGLSEERLTEEAKEFLYEVMEL